MYQPKTASFTQDIWILAVAVAHHDFTLHKLYAEDARMTADMSWRMRMAGWIWRKDMPSLWKPCFFDRSAWCIKQGVLNEFDNLLDIDEKGDT
jgi:hypothetical protein